MEAARAAEEKSMALLSDFEPSICMLTDETRAADELIRLIPRGRVAGVNARAPAMPKVAKNSRAIAIFDGAYESRSTGQIEKY